MEIKFENKLVPSYREVSHQLKRIQESAETVVPDTNDDIGRIASVHTSVMLKSKDVTGRGVQVSGEVSAVLLYITESENGISYIRLSKAFAMEFETGDIEADTIAQINLSVTNAEARVLNPRKVSVTVELAGELSCYRQESVAVEESLPDSGCDGLHAKTEKEEMMLPNAVCEKTFALNEQFNFPAGKPVPSELVFQNVNFCVDESQHIGSKIIIKGSVNLEICYLSKEVNYPLRTLFSTPFSQIIDTGEEEMDSCTVIIQLTSAYYELIDAINGDKLLDAELHAVAQVVSRKMHEISYVSDAYSNRMPASCNTKVFQFTEISETKKIYLGSDEHISIAEDCGDVLSVFATVTQAAAMQGKFSAAICLDIIYESKSGSLSSARRLVNLEQEIQESSIRLMAARISDISVKPEGEALECHLSVEMSYQTLNTREISRVTEMELNEEKEYDISKFPSLFMVKQDGETLWELAKNYHSSIESIQAYNAGSENEMSGLLLIPREI